MNSSSKRKTEGETLLVTYPPNVLIWVSHIHFVKNQYRRKSLLQKRIDYLYPVVTRRFLNSLSHHSTTYFVHHWFFPRLHSCWFFYAQHIQGLLDHTLLRSVSRQLKVKRCHGRWLRSEVSSNDRGPLFPQVVEDPKVNLFLQPVNISDGIIAFCRLMWTR